MSLLQKALAYKQVLLYLNTTETDFNDDSDIDLDMNLIDHDDRILPKENSLSGISSVKVYYQIIDHISYKISKLSLENNAQIKFNEIIGSSFNFTKNALLVFNPPKMHFQFWHGTGLDKKSESTLILDLEYQHIYKNMVKEHYFFLPKTATDFQSNLSQLITHQDIKESDFSLFIPFVFSDRIIAIFLGLKMKNHQIPDQDIINTLIILGRFNGALLYNIFQQQTILSKKKTLSKTDQKNIPYNEQKYQKIIQFTDEIIKHHRDKKHALLHIRLTTVGNSENNNFNLLNFYSDIQFIVMNAAGYNSYVEIFEDLNIYIVLPFMNFNQTQDIYQKIKQAIENLFKETTSEIKPQMPHKTVFYPDEGTNSRSLINKIINI